MTKSKGKVQSSPEAKRNRAEGARRAAAKRRQVEALRRAGVDIPREPRKSSRGIEPYAQTIAALEADGTLTVTLPAPPVAPAAALTPDEPDALRLAAELDLGTAAGRLDFRARIARLLLASTIDARTADALGALAKAQARDVNPHDRAQRPRIVFATVTTRAQAEAVLDERSQAEDIQ